MIANADAAVRSWTPSGSRREVHRLVAVVQSQQRAGEIQIENVFLAGPADREVLDGGDQQRGFGALALNRLGRDAGRLGDLRQRGAGVAIRGEQLCGGLEYPCAGGLRLRWRSSDRYVRGDSDIDLGGTVMNTTWQ